MLAKVFPKPTLTLPIIRGNLLFERAVFVLGLDGSLMSRLLAEVLAGSGSTPLRATPDDLGWVLPEIERRMLQLAPHEHCAPGLARLRRLLLSWDGRS